MMKTLIPIEAGTFYALGLGHMLSDVDLLPGPLTLGSKIELNSMFEMWALHRGPTQVGYYFLSAFKTENKGGYVITFMENKRGKAKSHRLVIRLPNLIVYDFPYCGSLAISTKASDKLESIMMEQ